MKIFLLRILPIIWMGIIFFASSQPYQEQDIKPFLSNTLDLSFLIPYFDWIEFHYHHSEVSITELGINGLIEFFIRKGAHVTVFLVLMVLLYFACLTFKTKRKPSIIALFLTVAYAIFDEIHQGFTPNRTPFTGDVVLDSIGALLGLLFILTIPAKYKQRI
ncbi:VanZ family protein [Aquibacillus albus]|uniref:VanZ family protein n=1 Tax=Aquibacillus albus TaxID=1168171 RepID=A0ABS2MWJ5_9BACI|nr:VanZ family protein [Aquibacillus albus]MBM7570266.1 VanZ family protein [Aquibacillus albus]